MRYPYKKLLGKKGTRDKILQSVCNVMSDDFLFRESFG